MLRSAHVSSVWLVGGVVHLPTLGAYLPKVEAVPCMIVLLPLRNANAIVLKCGVVAYKVEFFVRIRK